MYWNTPEYRALARAYDEAFKRHDNARRSAESADTISALYRALCNAKNRFLAYSIVHEHDDEEDEES